MIRTLESLKHVVGVADMKVVSAEAGVIVTYALGSCLGLMVFDPVARVAAMLHAMLPASKLNREKALKNPWMFVDTGVPALFDAFYAAGGQPSRAITKVADCAAPLSSGGMFKIGSRNYSMLGKLFTKNGVRIAEADVGGTGSPTVVFDVTTGRVTIKTGRTERDL